MDFIFKGRLCGYICNECPEALSNVRIRLYRTRKDQDVTALAVADPKELFSVLSDSQVAAKAKSLLAETTTDAAGNYEFRLGEQQKYEGEAFEIDVLCETVPRLKQGAPKRNPVQFTLGVVQPRWKRGEQEAVAAWSYCIPSRFWCAIRARFGAWTICGQVTICDTEQPVTAVTVRAFDADWLQDDALGVATTGADGRFRIDYITEDFQKTPLPGVLLELVSGPDLYFRLEDDAGDALLEEPRSRGFNPDRTNVGNCFCVDLCIDTSIEPPTRNALFTQVGDFDIQADIDPTTGLTNAAVLGHGGPGFAFHNTLELTGFCPKTSPVGAPEPMRYRFLTAPLSDPMNLQPIRLDRLEDTRVGSRLILWKRDDDVMRYTTQRVEVRASGATPDPTPMPAGPGPWGAPPVHVIVPNDEGWIEVDQAVLGDGFQTLIRFKSQVAFPGGTAPGDGAGNPVSSQRLGVPIRIVFEAGPVTGGVTFTNELSRVLINNWSEVAELVILQLTAGGGGTGCSELTNDLNILYTMDHELPRSWSIGISSAASFPTIAPPLPSGPSAMAPRGENGNRFVNIASWPPCSYTVSLTRTLKLTDGEDDDSGRTTPITFCKE